MTKANMIVINVKNKKSKKNKKGTPGLSIMGRMVDVGASTGKAFFSEYIKQHRKSNRKKRDGWLVYIGGNLYKATGNAQKKVKLSKVITQF